MDIASKLVSLLQGTIAPHVTAEYRIGDIRHCYADLAHIQAVLGFQPKVGIDEGMKRFVEWVLTQEVPVDRLDEASAELRRMKLMS
jgi:dTDP-L-rhamnose 4-epimerase